MFRVNIRVRHLVLRTILILEYRFRPKKELA